MTYSTSFNGNADAVRQQFDAAAEQVKGNYAESPARDKLLEGVECQKNAAADFAEAYGEISGSASGWASVANESGAISIGHSLTIAAAIEAAKAAPPATDESPPASE